MKICFPVSTLEKITLDHQVYNHFGSAPGFVVVDTDTNSVGAIVNRDQEHAHGTCSPMRALAGQEVDAVVVGGIGKGALMGLLSAGLKVYQGREVSIGEHLLLLERNQLPLLQPGQVCGGHDQDKGCGCAH